MAPSADDLARLRRMVNEPDDTTYDDAALSAILARYPLIDVWGNEPTIWQLPLTQPPTTTANPNWIEAYDAHAAAAEIWEEKASIVAQDYDFTAPLEDGAYRRSQVYAQYMALSRRHASRRSASSIKVVIPPPPPLSVFGNVWGDIPAPPEWGWP